MEPGEIWKINVTLKNTGTTDAMEVTAYLIDNLGSMYVYNNFDGNVGTIPSNESKDFGFIVSPDLSLWYSSYECGQGVSFTLTQKSAKRPSDGHQFFYDDDNNFLGYSVGRADVVEEETDEGK